LPLLRGTRLLGILNIFGRRCRPRALEMGVERFVPEGGFPGRNWLKR
jgi:hypothetical protein